jgi:putative membrane protein
MVSTLAILVTANVLPGIRLDNAWDALILAAVLAFLNAVVKPLLVIFTIPFTIFTLGLFLLVINAIVILIAEYIVDGFHVEGFLPALWFSLCLTFVTWIFEALAGKPGKEEND